ncbi:MAG: lysophospholipid acyltransferase family protein [Myxococcota bacterium]
MAPLWIPLTVLVLRFGLGYRIEGLAEARARFRRILAERSGPLLICANHLTLIDSFLIAWALAPSWRYALRFDLLPWNVPERTNFSSGFWSALLTYLAKGIPITRGGNRPDVAEVLRRVSHLLARGELALIFPEGTRSRTRRVDVESAAWGVGRVIGGLPGCHVLCVYLRGRAQESWGRIPARGDRFHVDLSCIEPKSDQRGMRRSRDLSRQVVTELARMERSFLGDR